MKRIKSNHLWRRGATLLLAMLMLFTCVGSALPAFAEEAAGNTATVDSGDPVLADSSASGDSTGDTGTDLPDDPQRPTLPSGEDISEEAPPADESDGETVPPADSDSSEDPAAPDSGDSIPDESESEPAEQPGEGDADLPEDEQPSGEEPDPDEDEEIPENEPEDEPFEALVILDPENGAAVQAGVGEEVTFKAPVSREDVAVAYQWQRFQKPAAGSVQTEALYDYAEGETTEYWYALDDMREAEALAMNPDMLWPGIEMYYATVAALDEIGADSSDVSIAWKTPNFALEGYTISAAETESGIEVYADKDDERHVAHLNENSEWEFGEAEEKPETTGAWLNIEGANGPEYAFTVEERDYDASFRCEVTVLDEVYLEQCLSILEEQGIELTEEQRAAEQKLYSVVMSVENGKEEALPEDEPMTFSMARSMLRAAASGKPQLSADAQWIEGLDGNYQYITKDTYDRVSEWLAKGEITETQAARYWTYLRPNGYTGSTVANVLDENGKPTGTTRQYQGFDLTDGMLEVNSEWYGKTVYFRVAGSGGTGTAITIPAYTELETDENGNYIEGASGTKYKKAITFLNPYVPDAKSMYQAFLNVTAADGWLLEQDASGNPTGATKDMHIQTYIVDCDSFNADPQRYMVDAEGNYRMDSVGWGVCVSEEPDLSGKAYWVLKDYLANGYGFLAGHDTMYAYPGAYYDAFGADLDESTIDPNDGTTWYYDINSWLPGTVGYTRDGRQSNTRGGHFYMNQLMGSNKGNVYSNTTTPSDSVSMLLSTGGSHGKYEKNIMFGGEELQVEQFGYTAAQAEANAKYRTPTNYPYSFENRPIFPASLTHTNQQAAFGPIWVSYAGSNERLAEEYGYYDHSLTWNLDGKTGTNNFYLSGTGNFLMNQIGHLPKNSASILESFLFSNSVFYVSQRKQCEVCAANQHGQETVHFVRRINSANADAVLSALQAGGSYWYPIDGCYQLTEDLTLPEDWKPIKGFKGHWNSDVYTVTLNSKGTPLLDNTRMDGESGWNLGVNRAKGTQTVFNSGMTRTTGVARVLGDLNDLFGTDMDYAGYTVKILGKDNPSYMSASEVYDCTVNSDSKYVISNLPCIFDTQTRNGVLKARVYTPEGREVTEYGVIRVNVDRNFWNNDMTIPLYLGNFTVEPVSDEEPFESAQAFFSATTTASEKPSLVGWEYRKDESDTWQAIPGDWDVSLSNEERITADGDHLLTTNLTLNNADPAWDGYEFRAVFSSPSFGQWNTYEYWLQGAVASGTETPGSVHKPVIKPDFTGELTVQLWPAYAQQGADQTVYAGTKATFSSYGYALDDGTAITAEWQYSTDAFDPYNGGAYLEWHDVKGSTEWGGLEVITVNAPQQEYKAGIVSALSEVNPSANTDVFHKNAKFHGIQTFLTVDKVDIAQHGTHFRVKYTAISSHGTKMEWYSNIADEKSGAWTTDTGMFGGDVSQSIKNNSNILNVKRPELEIITTPSALCGGAPYIDTMTPDEYGQMLLLSNAAATMANGTATYEAILYYKPGDLVPTPTWQYMTYTDHAPKFWADSTGNKWTGSKAQQLGVNVTVTNTDLGDALYQGQPGYKAIKSVMTISNVPASMYNPETLTKYYFRCIGVTTYTTVKDTYSMARVDKWGGLVIDYAIDLHHNGVVNYGNTNIINGATVTDAAGIVQATTGRQSSVWTYPKLSIHVPAGHHINTAIVYFDSKVAHNSNDYISYNTSALTSLGITVQEADANKLVLISTTKNTVELDTWQTALRNYVSFTTYDNADFTASKVAAGTTGGAKIRWVVDELRLAGVQVDPNTGKAFKVVNAGKIISWDDAFSLARAYDPDIGTNGRLAEITNASENSLIYNLKGGDNGVRVWLGANSTGGWWQWKTSGNGLAYTPGGISGDGPYLVQNSNGSWSGLKASSNTSREVTMYNLGKGWSLVFSGTLSHNVWMENGHKYYVLAKFGDYFDANGYGPISCSALGIYARNNWCSDYNAWMSGVDDVYTYYGAAGNVAFNMSYEGHGTDYTGNYAVLYYLNVYDLTAAFGAGKEPDAAQCRTWFYGGSNPMANADYVASKTVTVGEQIITDVRHYAVEYDIPSLAFAVTDHSAEDETYIGTNAKYTPQPGDKTVTAIIDGNSKVYDGVQISPSAFTVYGAEGASESLFNITYTVEQGSYASYSPRTVNGSSWRDTGAVNAARYHAVAALTDAAIKAGWKLSDDSVLECDLIIYQRPINVYSYHNNRVYDQTSAGVIRNIQPEARSGDSGIIPGDTVRFNTTTVFGSYVDKNGKAAVHNSNTNNGGSEYTMYRSATLSDLYVLHTGGSDPHHNYTLGTETYTGAINKRPVVVHSLYLDDPENPRNVKTYDSTNQATITDILIDNVLPGDEIGLKQQTMTGTYATAQAGETLTADGKTQKDRLKKLKENVITASTKAELTGNDFGDYFIEKESYSGAICREVLEVRIKNQVKLYGEADIETPWHINSFDANSTSNPKGWLSITGLKGTDKIELKDSFFKLGAFAPDNSTIAFGKQTPVGRYPVTETGITEANLPVLKNYIVSVYDGQLEIEPREVVVTASDGDWYVEDEGVPEVHATFEVQNDDRETYRLVGADNEASYANMLLMNSDTVEKFIRVTDGTAPAASSSTGQLRKILTSEAREYEEDGVKSTMLRNGSNIWYDTAWYVHAPARYLDLEAEYTLYPCEWCEQYHGFAMGTDHWHITGYETKVNQDAEKGDVLTVATVENPLGETVQNYKLRFVSGTLRVHPKLRFQLKATVPMYVCMYAYNGDGEVVEPTEYGITNYSNGAIRVTDINVDPTGGFLITDKAPLDLLRGEMSMNMFGTQLVPGANTPANPERWIAAADESEGVDGVFLHLPLECYIAGGNVNDETVCTPVTKVQYTIAEYGKTVPEVDDAELPEYIHGEPVTPSTTG